MVDTRDASVYTYDSQPDGPWVMEQTWHDLLFAHWPIVPDQIRPHVPASMALDTFQGLAWLAVTPFWVSGLRLRGFPPPPFVSSFNEINVRTYVVAGGEPGILFLSLDANTIPGVTAARLFYRLPYYNARIVQVVNETRMVYSSRRFHPGARPAAFVGSYQPCSPIFHAPKGSLEHWCIERYRLFTTDRHERLYKCEIRHKPWPLQQTTVKIKENSMAQAHAIQLPETKPMLHYAGQLTVHFWPLQLVADR